MDRYQRVEKPRPESAINENEIRITTQGLIRNYISYATNLLQEKHAREIVFKAMGQAINKAVAVAEIIKKRIHGLHQDTSISSVSITDVWEPIEEGLVPLEVTRHVSMISISLSTSLLNKNSPGYQPALHVEQPKQQQRYQQPQYFHQQQQPRQPPAQYNDDSYGRGRGRSRGRGRGWVRGGYGGNGGYGGYGGYANNNGYANNQGYANNHGYANNQGYENNQGYTNNQDYVNNRENGGWNDQFGRGGGRGRGDLDYRENGGWNDQWGRGGGRGRGDLDYRGAGYERGRGGGGRGYVRGRGGRTGGLRGRGNNAY